VCVVAAGFGGPSEWDPFRPGDDSFEKKQVCERCWPVQGGRDAGLGAVSSCIGTWQTAAAAAAASPFVLLHVGGSTTASAVWLPAFLLQG
jgi:hypothetical protein